MITRRMWIFNLLLGWIFFQRKLKFSCGNSGLVPLILLIAFNVICLIWSSLLGVTSVTLIQNLLLLCWFIALLHCVFWHHILQVFGWSVVFSQNMFDNLSSLLVGHPFHGRKKTLWLAIICAFFMDSLERTQQTPLSRSVFQIWVIYRLGYLCCFVLVQI